MMKTKAGRALTSAITFGTALDIILSYFLAGLFTDQEFWFSFFAIIAFLWFVPLLFGLKSILYKTIFYYVKRGSNRRTLVQEFRKAELPLLSETDFNDPADLYLVDVAEDDRLPKAARLFASTTIGQLASIRTYSLADLFIAHANLDAALAIYFDEMRRDGVRPHLNGD